MSAVLEVQYETKQSGKENNIAITEFCTHLLETKHTHVYTLKFEFAFKEDKWNAAIV
jgi:hypothetical protein